MIETIAIVEFVFIGWLIWRRVILKRETSATRLNNIKLDAEARHLRGKLRMVEKALKEKQ